MLANELQQQFFNHLKSVLPSHISMVDELTELLNLSYDSVYRRIRGEKPLALNELRQICEQYHISLDQVLQLQNDTVVFHAPDIERESLSFLDYLEGMYKQLKYFNSFPKKQMLYFCKDMIFFHFYLFPEIAAFKTFFWNKTILNSPAYNKKSFSLAEFPFDDCFAIGQKIIQEYNLIPSIELWNYESIHSSVSQLQYYRDSGLFASTADFERVVSSLEKTFDHLHFQAEVGIKFMPGDSEVSYRAAFQFYINEVVLGSNTILVDLDGKRLSIIPHSVFHYIITKDNRFNDQAFGVFNNIVRHSTLISGAGAKDRNRFFHSMKEKIQALRK